LLGIGKVLLAHLPQAQRDAYLAGGLSLPSPKRRSPIRPICPRTRTSGQGRICEDRGEIDPAISCVAVPIRRPDGSVPAAISVSRLRGKGGMKTDAVLAALHTTAAEIEKSCFGS
jgi:DNA-binding IclR family transcriptional regulator